MGHDPIFALMIIRGLLNLYTTVSERASISSRVPRGVGHLLRQDWCEFLVASTFSLRLVLQRGGLKFPVFLLYHARKCYLFQGYRSNFVFVARPAKHFAGTSFESSLCPLGFVFSAYRSSLFRFPNKRIFPIAPHSRRARKEEKILNSTKKTWTHFGGLKSRLLFLGFP